MNGSKFQQQIEAFCDKYSVPGNRGGFMTDLMMVLVSAIQGGRAAAQGASGFVMCGKCNKIVHHCPKPGEVEKP